MSIITFNYHRSIEHYLLNSLSSWHGRPLEECEKKLAEIPIVHVYGQLGKHQYGQTGYLRYRSNIGDFAHVADAAAGITLFHEPADTGAEEARKRLVGAECVCFWGFGYHEPNLARLAVEPVSERFVVGTGRGLRGKEATYVERRVFETVRSHMTLSAVDSLDLLRDHMLSVNCVLSLCDKSTFA